MKILSLNFRNINSLAGDSQINFTQGAIANAGVFAITGANGAGKSSILDAITLALYGETARFDQPASSVISQNTNEAYAEVEFKLGEESYQSVWQIQKEVDVDSVQVIDMKLTRVSDAQVLATTPSEVCRRIIELTGMDFRSFTRSMMLAQGDFAAFLNALDNERMGILETLIGSDIYQDYRQEILTNAEQAKQSVDSVKHELARINFLSPEVVEAAEHDLLDYQEQLQALQSTQEQLEAQQLALKNTADLQIQVVEQKKRLKELHNQLDANQQDLDSIAIAKQALAYQDDLSALDAKQNSVQQQKAAWNALIKEQQFLREQLGENANVSVPTSQSFSEQLKMIDGMKVDINQTRLQLQEATSLLQALAAQASDKKTALDAAETWLSEHASDESLLTNFPETARLKNVRTELKALTDKHKQLSTGVKKSSDTLSNTSKTLTQTAADIVELKQQLQAEQRTQEDLLQGHQPAAIEALKTEQLERVQQFKKLYDLAVSYQKVSQPSSGLWGVFAGKQVLAEDPDALQVELDQLRETIKREENIKQTLETFIGREALLKRLMAERVHLVDGKPCPLCGSKEHPYVRFAPAIGNSVQALTDQQMKLRELVAKADQLNKRILTAQKNAEKNRAVQAQLQSIHSAWLSLGNRLNVASAEFAISQLPEMAQWVKDEQNELKNIQVLADQYRKKSDVIAKIIASIAKNEVIITELQNNAEQLDAGSLGLAGEYQEIEAELARCRHEEQVLAEKVSAQLTVLGEAMPGKGKEDAFFDRLNSRRQDYQANQLKRNALLDDLAVLNSQESHYQAEIIGCNEKIDQLINELQGEEKIGVHLALIEKQQLIAEKERIVSEQEQQFTGLQEALSIQLQASPFANLTELRSALQWLVRESEFIQLQIDINAQIVNKNLQLERLSAELDNDFMVAESAPSMDEIYRQLGDVANKIDMAQLDVGRLQRRLAQQLQQQQRFDELTLELQQREQLAQPALAELSLLDEGNGMTFRRRVQLRIADKLISQTNRVLEKISGRYYLRAQPELAGLALEIEDTYQNNLRRHPKTLSGGESFVVSLALALSLSELASNNKSVDSLFIDEGFGNLDAESLTLVLGALESLRAYGKTVGVISHVDTVKKRIKTQVQIVKRPNGLGVLKKAS